MEALGLFARGGREGGDQAEGKKAPDSIAASKAQNGATVRTRPLCAYPQVASYKGSGSTDDAANFVCK